MITFKSKAAADLLMFKATADELLRLIDHEPSAQGIVPAAELATALQKLEQAIAAEASEPVLPVHPTSKTGETDEAAEPAVGLHQRAWPLMELMKRALAEGEAVVWGV
jgi:Domain of unknown function (DUF1840)